MKLFLALLLFPVCVLAGVTHFHQMVIAKKNASGPAPTYIVDEDCDGVTTPAGFADVGMPEWGDTDAPAPIVSGGSLRNSSGNYSYTTFADNSTLYVFGSYHVASSLSANPYIVEFRKSGTVLSRLRVLSSGALRLYNDTGTSTDSSAGEITADNTYYYWIKYVKGTGSDSETVLHHAATQTKPGSPLLTITTGAATLDCNQLSYNPSAAVTTYHDKLRVDDVDIGSSPP